MKISIYKKIPEAGNDNQKPMVRWALVSLGLSMLLPSLGTSIAIVALPTIARVFSASFQEVQWVIITYLLAITVMIVGVGRLGDLLGRRRVLLGGIFLFTAASVLCGIAPTLWILIFARVIQGIAAAILMALTVALVREAVPKEMTGTAMGLLGTMSAVGTTLGPSLGGFLIVGAGWRAIFFVMVPLGVINYIVARHYLPVTEPEAQSTKPDHKRFDSWGTLLLGLALAAYALAVTTGEGQFNRDNLLLLLAAFLCGSLFVFSQARVTSPLIQLTAFRDVVLSSGLTMNALVATVMMTTLVVGPFYLSRALGLTAPMVGIVMSIGPVISVLCGIPAGRIVDRFGAHLIAIAGLTMMTAGSIALSVLPAWSGLVGYVVAIAILTPGYQLFQAANNTAVMMDVVSNQRGVISGMLNLSRNLGLITGSSVMGAVFAFAARTSDITSATPGAVENGFQITFVVAGGLAVFALSIAVINHIVLTRSFPREGAI